MKNLLLLFATLFVFFNVSAQIPNPSFENWDNNGLYDEPTGWFTYNRYFTETGVTLCEKTTQHTDGAYALKLISKYSSLQKSVWPGWALSSDDTAQVDIKWGFPCTHRPVYFNCDIIYDHRGQDVGMVYIKFTRIRTALAGKPVAAVSPIIGGKTVKGPAAKMFSELGIEPSALAVARHYGESISGFVLDAVDAHLADKIQELGIRPLVVNTLMKNTSDRQLLAQDVLHLIERVTA